MKSIDINCDMGESFGSYKLGMDEEIIKYITSANIACGFHAGDPIVMDKTVMLARQHRVKVGAHPGYPDLAGFGRRNMECSPREIKDYLIYQIGALKGFCTYHGVKMQHVKPHGSLYNACVGNESISRAVAEAIAAVDKDLFWVALAGRDSSLASSIAEEVGIRVAFEAFPDRAYTRECRLAPRSLPDAVIKNSVKAAQQAVMMALEGRTIALDGTPIPMQVHTLCVHGDNPAALDAVRIIRDSLRGRGVNITSLSEVC